MVAVRGRSILPFCHFELEESDYLISGRRRMDLLINNNSTQAPATFVDRQTRVIEFQAIGIGSPINRSFSVLNPTATDYTYRWICEDNLDLTKQPSFVCRTVQGKIASGKGVQVLRTHSYVFFLLKLSLVDVVRFLSAFIRRSRIVLSFRNSCSFVVSTVSTRRSSF